MEEKPEASIQETIWSLIERFDDGESVFGNIGYQLERIADAVEAIEKRGRPSKTYGLFND